MVTYKYIAPSGIQSTEAEGRLLSVHNSTSKPPRHQQQFTFSYDNQFGSNDKDIQVSQGCFFFQTSFKFVICFNEKSIPCLV